MTGLEACFSVPRRDITVDLGLAVTAGSIAAILGPSGAGKSTTLRALAGLVALRQGRVRLGGLVLDDTERGLRVAAEDRPVGLVFQDYALFPHLSARDNVAFGLRARGVGRAAARATADAWLARMSLGNQGDSRPSALSGGQAQRVALARALAVQPAMLLLDEPLAALDAATRGTVRADLRQHLAAYDGDTVMVTHDPIDALVLADTVFVVEHGAVVQQGRPAEIARRPRTDYVARVMGVNLLPGHVHAGAVELEGGGRMIGSATAILGPVHVAIRPNAIALFAEQPAHGSPRNTWPATVTTVEERGEQARLSLAGPPDVVVDVTTAAIADLRLSPGVALWCSVKATDVDVYPR